jgi:hypothetical protein
LIGFGRKRLWPLPTFTCRTEKTTKTSVLIGGVPDDIRTEHSQNTSLEHYCYISVLGLMLNQSIISLTAFYHTCCPIALTRSKSSGFDLFINICLIFGCPSSSSFLMFCYCTFFLIFCKPLYLLVPYPFAMK